jgi:serine/threonine-protein kinase HipA
MIQKVDVMFCGWGQDWQIGTVAGNGNDVIFEYSDEAIARQIQWSFLRMPLSRDSYSDFPAHQHYLPGLLSDALPDGWGMLLMDRFFKKHFGIERYQITPLDRLIQMGNHAAGALRFVPAADAEMGHTDLQLLDLVGEIDKVHANSEHVELEQLLIAGSAQGARPKAFVNLNPETGALSTNPHGPGQPWLVKFPAKGEHPEVCAIEYAYSEIARQCRLDMPDTRLFDLGKHAAFAIQRFDRQGGMRVPLHTLAGVLHTDFRTTNTDYQTLIRLTRAMTQSELEAEKAFERCVFNVAMHNRDDHAKNFSYVMDDTMAWKMSPCYDLTFSLGPGGQHHLDIEGEGAKPAKSHLLALAKKAGLSERWAAGKIAEIAEQALTFPYVAKNLPIRKASIRAIAKAIEANVNRL